MRSDLPALYLGPYFMPPCRVGGRLGTIDHGDQLVLGITDAPIAWPYTIRWSRRSLCLTGDLVVAVRCETVIAVASWWGVSRSTVRIWRRALGVARFNPGTLECWRRSAPRLQKGRRQKG